MNAMKMSIAMTIVAVIYLISMAAASHVEEVCQWETFKARCADDEVIVMKQARYGRMRFGKCIPHNSYSVGCSADVTEYMHGRCSGRQECEVAVPDPVMFAHQPCSADLVAHLEAEYECIRVTKWDQKSCDNVLTATSGFIAKPTEMIKDIRMRHQCPHRIVAQPGQTINVYLSDFFNKYHYQPTFDVLAKKAPVPDCIKYGHINEENSASSHICGGKLQKDALIYHSKSNVVDITLAGPSSTSHHYLIKFEVVGCPKKIEAPQNGWIEYEMDKAFIHCKNSNAVSELVCNVNQWEGHMPECVKKESPLDIPVSAKGPFSSTGVIVAIVAGITFGIVLGGLVLVFAACHKKSSPKQQQLPIYQQPSKSNESTKSFNGSQDYHVYTPVVDPNYVSTVKTDVIKAFAPSSPVHHIVHNLSSVGNYAVILPAETKGNIYTL